MASVSEIVYTLLLVLAVLALSSHAASPEEITTQLTQGACDFSSNTTLQEEFYESVKTRHGSEQYDYDEHYDTTTFNRTKKIRCYYGCPGISRENVTWCVNVFDHVQGRDYEVCVNASGKISSTAAQEIDLASHFELPEDCGYSEIGCLEIREAPFYLLNSILTCKTEVGSCLRLDFIQLHVEALLSSLPEIIHITTPPDNVAVLGSTITLRCLTLLAGTRVYAGWSRYGNYYDPIIGDPNCVEECTSEDHENQRRDRVRMYQVVETVETCPNSKLRIFVYLVIDNVTKDDEGNYSCEAYAYVNTPRTELKVAKKQVTLETVHHAPAITDVVCENKTAAVLSVVTLTCTVHFTGPTEPSVEIKRYDGSTPSFSDSQQLSIGVGTVMIVKTIQSVQFADGGTYLCNAKLAESHFSKKFNLEVVKEDPLIWTTWYVILAYAVVGMGLLILLILLIWFIIAMHKACVAKLTKIIVKKSAITNAEDAVKLSLDLPMYDDTKKY